jgi:hypothetical protein
MWVDTVEPAPPEQQRLVHRCVGSIGAAEHQFAIQLEPSSVVLDQPSEGALVAAPRRSEQAAFLIDVCGITIDRHTPSNDRHSLN